MVSWRRHSCHPETSIDSTARCTLDEAARAWTVGASCACARPCSGGCLCVIETRNVLHGRRCRGAVINSRPPDPRGPARSTRILELAIFWCRAFCRSRLLDAKTQELHKQNHIVSWRVVGSPAGLSNRHSLLPDPDGRNAPQKRTRRRAHVIRGRCPTAQSRVRLLSERRADGSWSVAMPGAFVAVL